MTPEREAAYALDYGVAWEDLGSAAQADYDRLAAERAAGLTGQVARLPAGGRSSARVSRSCWQLWLRSGARKQQGCPGPTFGRPG